MTRLLQALTVAAALAAQPAVAQGTALSPQEVRAAVIVSLDSGQYGQAADLAEALVARDPQDHDALLLSSRVNQTGFTGEPKARKVSYGKRQPREPFFDRGARACCAHGLGE